jgi:glycosyltransferase involved in cell wall biosynthesis
MTDGVAVTSQPASIAVVIPAFEAESFVGRAIRSALEQTLTPHEIVVVDDGSSDGTGEIARSFGPPVRCVRQPNQGAAGARNRGVEEARADYVAFLDADDEWFPRHLERALEVLQRHPELMWFCAAYSIRFWSGRTLERRPDERYLIDEAYFENYFEMARGWNVSTCSIIARYELFEQVGGFDTSLRVGEDQDLWLRIALRHPRIGYSPLASFTYRLTEGSLMNQGLATPEMVLELLRGGERQAAAHGPDGLWKARPVLARQAERAIRTAAHAGNRGVLEAVGGTYLPDLPAWVRLLRLACLHTPSSLWLGSVRVWDGFRLLRLSLRNRRASPG